MRIIDIETYKNYFMIGVLDPIFFTYKVFRINDKSAFRKEILNKVCVTFNGKNFDLPILFKWLSTEAIKDYDLYKYGQGIITDRKFLTWETKNECIDFFNDFMTVHIDLMTFFTKRIGLKQIAINNYSDKIEDLPYLPHENLTNTQKIEIDKYCKNDCICTFDILKNDRIRSDIEIRKYINENIEPFKSSDKINAFETTTVQIAEKFMIAELKSKNNGKLPNLDNSDLKVSNCIGMIPEFKSEFFKNFLNEILNTEITTIKKEHLNHLSEKQQETNKKKYYFKNKNGGYKSNYFLNYDGANYNFGLGGLHSKDVKRVWESSNTHVLINVDVSSYYPSIIEKFKIEGIKGFSEIEADWKQKRYYYKNKGDLLKSNTYKLMINSIFGKLNDTYSKLKSSHSAFSVTLTGQVLLLYLIESVQENIECRIVNANTDGVCFYIKRSDTVKLKYLCSKWELETGMVLDYDYIDKWIGLGVNEYFAKIGEKTKTKGARLLTSRKLDGKLQATVVSEAVISYFLNKTDIKTYIRKHANLNNILISSKSTKGFHIYNNKKIQKSVRYYHSKNGFELKSGHGSIVASKCNVVLDISILKMKTPVSLRIDYMKYIELSQNLINEILSGEVTELKEKSELGIINATASRYLYNFENLEKIGVTIDQLFPSKTLTSRYENVKKTDQEYYENGKIKGTNIKKTEALCYQFRVNENIVVLEKENEVLILSKDIKTIPRKKLQKLGYKIHHKTFIDFKLIENLQQIQSLINFFRK